MEVTEYEAESDIMDDAIRNGCCTLRLQRRLLKRRTVSIEQVGNQSRVLRYMVHMNTCISRIMSLYAMPICV